jgi:hypothetical protein
MEENNFEEVKSVAPPTLLQLLFLFLQFFLYIFTNKTIKKPLVARDDTCAVTIN